MKFIAVVFVALAISAQADESEYNNYQTHYDHHQQDPYAGYNSDLTSAYSNSISEKDSGYPSDDLDMDVILPVVVFGGLGLGALAYVDSLNRMNNLCNKIREITNLARMNAMDGTATVALAVDANDGTQGAGATAQVTPANAAINSNRLFINALINIDNLDC